MLQIFNHLKNVVVKGFPILQRRNYQFTKTLNGYALASPAKYELENKYAHQKVRKRNQQIVEEIGLRRKQIWMDGWTDSTGYPPTRG
ncbi:unnamed protein product [Acanthoscelides obtectus]|uniref:Uncharacterized protein n=1 Tax=Acanthoscelides obtectus TaxID=200917 RepID=A0A9P0L9W6_ACAOB|nr:unnamed protein product [Acanthoscelides obtectus]CAK1675974.1 hypothetical protein AOBTE_LOCUS30521 [Acanthoscelides obtectus]